MNAHMGHVLAKRFCHVLSSRHPLGTNRPSFSSLKHSLLQPEETLLKWTESDLQVHPQASVIRAPLEAAVGLYGDLQKIYIL